MFVFSKRTCECLTHSYVTYNLCDSHHDVLSLSFVELEDDLDKNHLILNTEDRKILEEFVSLFELFHEATV
jgi:hypothetical protein